MSALGRKLLYHLIEHKSIEEVSALGFDYNRVLRSEVLEAFEYVLEIKKLQSRYPSQNELEVKFGLKLIPTPEADLNFVVDQLKKQHVTNLMGSDINKMVSLLDKQDPMAAIQVAKKIETYAAHLASLDDGKHSFKYDYLDRVEMYQAMKDNFYGIESKWPTLNRVLGGGWTNGLFHVITALTSTGKSWLLSIIADDMSSRLKPDENILVISTEMDTKRLARRVDCVKFKVPFVGLRDGTLTDDEENNWGDGLEKCENDHPDFVCSDILFLGSDVIQTVRDVRAAIDKYKSSAVLIDGGYRLKSARGSTGWDAQVEIIDDILAGSIQTQIPWIVTAQLGDASEKGKSQEKRKVNSWNMRYAKEWLINPDVVIAMQQTPDLELEDLMDISFLKIRDGDGPKQTMQITWEKSTLTFDEYEEEEDNSTPSGGINNLDEDEEVVAY